MVQFLETVALTVRDAEEVWALSLLSAALETRTKLVRTIKIRRMGASKCAPHRKKRAYSDVQETANTRH
jgi:hypothetical protein